MLIIAPTIILSYIFQSIPWIIILLLFKLYPLLIKHLYEIICFFVSISKIFKFNCESPAANKFICLGDHFKEVT